MLSQKYCKTHFLLSFSRKIPMYLATFKICSETISSLLYKVGGCLTRVAKISLICYFRAIGRETERGGSGELGWDEEEYIGRPPPPSQYRGRPTSSSARLGRRPRGPADVLVRREHGPANLLVPCERATADLLVRRERRGAATVLVRPERRGEATVLVSREQCTRPTSSSARAASAARPG